jgi:hypothetical protein
MKKKWSGHAALPKARAPLRGTALTWSGLRPDTGRESEVRALPALFGELDALPIIGL